MSNDMAMGKFLKNPRPFLLPPQPRPPCKLVVLGPQLSGKTTVAHLLALRYGAKVRIPARSQLVYGPWYGRDIMYAREISAPSTDMMRYLPWFTLIDVIVIVTTILRSSYGWSTFYKQKGKYTEKPLQTRSTNGIDLEGLGCEEIHATCIVAYIHSHTHIHSHACTHTNTHTFMHEYHLNFKKRVSSKCFIIAWKYIIADTIQP